MTSETTAPSAASLSGVTTAAYTPVAGLGRLAAVVALHPSHTLLVDGTAPSDEFRAAVRDIVIAARQHDAVRVERLIIALRGAWRQMPQIRAMPDTDMRDALWRRLVLLYVKEFFGRGET